MGMVALALTSRIPVRMDDRLRMGYCQPLPGMRFQRDCLWVPLATDSVSSGTEQEVAALGNHQRFGPDSCSTPARVVIPHTHLQLILRRRISTELLSLHNPTSFRCCVHISAGSYYLSEGLLKMLFNVLAFTLLGVQYAARADDVTGEKVGAQEVEVPIKLTENRQSSSRL